MTLKEELEILRGEPIKVFDGDPMDIPCIETSDAEKLCKHPVVSVHMITYNHEPYIRQAIEGVMMQKTDFEFELVIGEDASTDKTREICFEYQKIYPDKIRVLWWHENLRKVNHPAGANGRRTLAHCRGEFIAYCEGDDYWTDPLKLQKQVDVMRKNPSVGLIYTNCLLLKDNQLLEWDEESTVKYGLMDGTRFIFMNVFSKAPYSLLSRESYLPTGSVMYRSSTFLNAKTKYEILDYRLRLGDVPIWLGLAGCADVFGLEDKTNVYRIHEHGAVATLGAALWRDNILSRIYFFRSHFGLQYSDFPPVLRRLWINVNLTLVKKKTYFLRVYWFLSVLYNKISRTIFLGSNNVSATVKALYLRFFPDEYVDGPKVLCESILGELFRLVVPCCLRKTYRRILKRGEYTDVI